MYEIVQYAILTSLCTYLVLTYSAPSVSFHVKFWSIVTWTLNFGMGLLVPEDVYITMDSSKNHQKSDKIMFEYLFLYWSVYLLTWTIIPVLQEWENSGDLLSSDRLKRSLRVNGVFYLYMLIGAIICLCLLVYFDVGGQMGLRTYLKCLATCWGVLLQMVMMGYGMVQIPRSLSICGQPSKYLAYCYQRVRELQQQKDETQFQFRQITSFILYSQAMQPKDDIIHDYCQKSLNLIPQSLKHNIPYTSYKDFLDTQNYIKNYPIGIQSSIEHHRLIKRILSRHRRLTKQLHHFVTDAILYEDILTALQEQEALNSAVVPKNKIYSWWYLSIAPKFYKTCSVILGILAALILIAETQVFLQWGHRSLLGWLLLFDNLEVLRVLVYIVIVYISYTVYYSLFRIKLSNLYGLYRNQSDGPSLMFATINFSRVAFAIVLNFFQMLNLEGVYVDAMGAVEMGLLGEWVIKGMPGVLWLIVLCHYFDIWGTIINKFSLSQDLKFTSHIVDQDERKTKSIPFLVRKMRIQLKTSSDCKNSLDERLL